VLYYITTVASEDNLALIYKYAERVKQARDALPGSDSENIYVLSDLAQALIKKWEEKKGWSMQTWPTKVGLPLGLVLRFAKPRSRTGHRREELSPRRDGQPSR
jgi:sister-chromatid-cohesion protein PDS5